MDELLKSYNAKYTIGAILAPPSLISVKFTFISDNEHHISNYIFIYFISIRHFVWFWAVAFLKFLKSYDKETAWWGIYFVTQQVSWVEMIFGEVFRILRTSNQQRNFKQLPLIFLIFFLSTFYLFIFFLFEAMYHLLVLCKQLLLLLKYSFKNDNFIKNKSFGYYFSLIYWTLIDLAKINTKEIFLSRPICESLYLKINLFKFISKTN